MKKILSCVLALAFTASIATTSFARDINETSNLGMKGSNGQIISGAVAQVQPASALDGEANGSINRISAVFNYVGGIMVSYQDANRGFTVFDAGQPRASFVYNELSGSYSLASLNFNGQDFAKIDAMDGKDGAEKMKNYLISIGISPNMLKSETFDPDNSSTTGTGANAKQGDVAWLSNAYDALKGGVTKSISIDFQAAKGATLTISEFGRPQETLSAQAGPDGKAYVTQEFVYNNGFLNHIKELTFVTDGGKTMDFDDAAQSTDGVALKQSHRIIQMDGFGKQSEVKVPNGDGGYTTTMKFEYSANGSLNFTNNLETGDKTYYVGNKQSYTMNKEGWLTQKFSYNKNGTMDKVETFNSNSEDPTKRGSVTSRTVFNYGQVIATVEVSEKNKGSLPDSNTVRKAVTEIRAEAKKAGATDTSIAKLMEKYHISSFPVKVEDLSNSKLMGALGISQSDINYMKNHTNGNAAVANVNVSFNTLTLPAEETHTFTINEGPYKGQTLPVETNSNGEKQVVLPNGTKMNVLAEGASGGNNKGTLNTKTVEGSTEKVMTYSVTINDRGAQSYSLADKSCHYDKVGGKVTNSSVNKSFDPVVIGTQGGFVGANGQALVNANGQPMTNAEIAAYIADGGEVYVSVSANELNIMDGKSFQDAKGEEILVQVKDADVFNELAANVGKEIMLMGDVKNSVGGKKTMEMNVTYGGGFKTGASEIANMKNTIQSIESGTASKEVSAANAWVQQNLDSNSWLQGVAGSMDTKWDLLVANRNSGGAIQKMPKIAIQGIAIALALF